MNNAQRSRNVMKVNPIFLGALLWRLPFIYYLTYRKKKVMAKIRINGKMLIKEVGIKGMANVFHMVFSESRKWRLSVSWLTFDSLPSLDSKDLEIFLSKKEVCVALSS